MPRNKKRIKHLSELPDWFEICKYDKAKQLDLAGWYEQLSIRKESEYIIDWHKLEDGDALVDKFINETKDFKDVIKLVRQNPIVDTSSNPQLSSYFYFSALRELLPGVRPLTVEELIRVENSIEPEKLALLRLCSTSSRYFYHPMRKQLNEPVQDLAKRFTTFPHYIAHVNWNLSDTLLIEHFKQYLTTCRPNKIENTKRYRKLDLNNWYRFGILPYLDLKLWETEADVTIPNRVMADAIFPNGEQGEETIRKTTTPLAETLQDDDTLELLASQVSLEIAEQNKG